jgi:hypothetical protein
VTVAYTTSWGLAWKADTPAEEIAAHYHPTAPSTPTD